MTSINNRQLVVSLGLCAALIAVVGWNWTSFLCFGDRHPWLLQGMIQGIIAGALINFIIWWLNTSKDRMQYKNIMVMLALELDYNHHILSILVQGGPETPLKITSFR